MSEQRTFESYRLPDGSVVPVDASASRGARFIAYQLKGGTVVRASLVLRPLALIERLERTRFECEGGSLEMNVHWQELKRYVERTHSEGATK